MPTRRLHVFTSSANLVISSLTGNPDIDTVEYLVVGGGGGAGAFQTVNPPAYGAGGHSGSGGGAGGMRTGNILLSQSNVATYTVTVGAGGTSNVHGNSSTFLDITSLGGGAGWGQPGGSGGGGIYFRAITPIPGGSGTPGQGNSGGSPNAPPDPQNSVGGSGGGGTGGSGGPAPRAFPGGHDRGANGGIGASVTWVPASYGTTGPTPGRWFAGGGAGGGYTQFAFPDSAGYYGGVGGGGNSLGLDAPLPARAGTTNTGGGGAGSGTNNNPGGIHPGGSGGSGIVIIRYPLVDIAPTIQSRISRVSNVTANLSILTPNNLILFTISTVNAANGEVLYYSTNNQPNAAFTTGNTGSFAVNANVGTVTITLTSNLVTDTFMDLQVRRASATGTILKSGGNVYTFMPILIQATGGAVTNSGGYRIHTFTTSNSFVLTTSGSPSIYNSIDYLVVAGGGGGGTNLDGGSGGGGGGGGGFRSGNLTLTANTYTITVGGGGAENSTGANSVFSGIISAGGGGGSRQFPTFLSPNAAQTGNPGLNGGSGGGGGGTILIPAGERTGPGGLGNTPPTSPSQGNNGGAGGGSSYPNTATGGGGGGAGAVGGTAPNGVGGNGGAGANSAITGANVTYAGGGGGGGGRGPSGNRDRGTGGAGGGGIGGEGTSAAGLGDTNTGGGGGGGGNTPAPGRLGGSGVVIIRYPYQ